MVVIPDASPSVAVVIPTRDRGPTVVRTVESVLAGGLLPSELIVVDQTRGPDTRVAMEAVTHPVVRYISSGGSGISAGLNRGISAASADVVAITGDDCEVLPTWLERIVQEFASDSRIGVVFGTILPGASPDEEGFSPSYRAAGRVTARRPRHRYLVGGTSACMAVRREAWVALGGFDETLGVGSTLGAAEDGDFASRALQSRWHVVEAPGVEIIHHGRIPWLKRAALIERNWFGTGAQLAKQLRTTPLATLDTLGRLGLRWVTGRSRIARGLGGGPHRATAGRAFVRGMWSGLSRPIDDRGRFVRTAGATTPDEAEETRLQDASAESS